MTYMRLFFFNYAQRSNELLDDKIQQQCQISATWGEKNIENTKYTCIYILKTKIFYINLKKFSNVERVIATSDKINALK